MLNLTLEETIDMFFANFGEDEKKKNVYKVMLQNGDHEKIIDRLDYLMQNWQPKFGEKIPSINEILHGGADELNAEVEVAWQEFVRTKNNHLSFKVIPDWVYTVQQLLGGARVSEEATDEDLLWQKKEFYKIFPAIKKGIIPTQRDPMALMYLTVGNCTMLIPDNCDPEKLAPDVKQAWLERKESLGLLGEVKAKEIGDGSSV